MQPTSLQQLNKPAGRVIQICKWRHAAFNEKKKRRWIVLTISGIVTHIVSDLLGKHWRWAGGAEGGWGDWTLGIWGGTAWMWAVKCVFVCANMCRGLFWLLLPAQKLGNQIYSTPNDRMHKISPSLSSPDEDYHRGRARSRYDRIIIQWHWPFMCWIAAKIKGLSGWME